MTTEDKIREYFAALVTANKKHGFVFDTPANYIMFKAGYLAMLNSLEQVEIIDDDGFVAIVYSLPEGVSRNE